MIATKLSARNNFMKSLFLLIIVIFCTSLQASPILTEEAITGKWLVVQAGNLKTKDLGLGDDIWEFKNNMLFVTSSGKKIGKPESFVIKNNEIIYGTHPYVVDINVIKLSEKKMTVEIRGGIQILEKINEAQK